MEGPNNTAVKSLLLNSARSVQSSNRASPICSFYMKPKDKGKKTLAIENIEAI